MNERIAIIALTVSLFGILVAILTWYFGADKPVSKARQGAAIAMGFGFCFLAGFAVGGLAWPSSSSSVEAVATAIVTLPGMPATVPAVRPGSFDWTSDFVEVSGDSVFVWHECPGEPENSCARWNMYEHNSPIPVGIKISVCRQDGAWIDDSGREHTGLDVGQYKSVSGITVRPCAIP